MKKTLKEIAEIVEGKVLGNENTLITNIAGIAEAKEGDITFVSNPKYIKFIETTKASGIIIAEDQKDRVKIPAIVSKNPYFSYAKLLKYAAKEKEKHPSGISKNCSISESVIIENNVAISDFSVIDENVRIDSGTVIYPNCYIGKKSKIGKNCIIYPNVTIREETIIGNSVIIHSGTVIGSDGFGYVPLNNKIEKIPQIGTVEICDDVEIGANVTIDRATTGKTFIGKGTKIDNLVQIAHNVHIGENSIIVAQTGISGSTEIGKGVTIAGQAGLGGHLTIGDGATIGAQSGVMGDVPPKETVSGYPARPHGKAMRIYALIQKLPELFEELKKLKSRIKHE
ncbi:MAG: UDP-3-O-(3-hydroxymyristoyl)glucosamine N-acyltransferase [Elusimicrobia bacterium]|nr:UDP-3-O-(3-hydroxymyristoyl)glucosamine N-acyltransferase [Elusimicrobiota bacterium]